MPKNKRLSLKELSRRQSAEEFKRITFIRKTVARFRGQDELDTMLLQQEDPVRRKKLFDFVRPFCKFANPQFPTNMEAVGALVSVVPKIIRPPQQFKDDDDKLIRI